MEYSRHIAEQRDAQGKGLTGPKMDHDVRRFPFDGLAVNVFLLYGLCTKYHQDFP